MRAVLAGETVLDSSRGKLLHRTGDFPKWLFPLADVRADVLQASGTPGNWDLRVGDRIAQSAVVTAPRIGGPAGAELDGMVDIDYSAVDHWFEEDDPVYAHPRDPYHRVDVRSSSRRVIVRCESDTVAQTTRPKLLFETSLPVRYYLPFADVRVGLLQLSETVSQCPYKGDGQHWHLVTESTTIKDAAWSLPHPLPEGFAAADHICFYPEKVDVEVDGQQITQ
jgi:uncharacterized protein (DUF427 family)